MFGPSRKQLENELAGLKAKVEQRAMRLVADGATPQRLLAELAPWTERQVALQERILRKTPWRELESRLKELDRALAKMPECVERRRMQLERTKLALHLTTNTRRRPLTLAAFVLFAAVVFVMVVLPPLVVEWLAP